MTDVFNNSSNDYIYPGLSPCPGSADDQYLEFKDEGLCITKGSEIVSCISYSDLKIPVNAFTKEQKILSAGEVTFIAGLTKELCNRKQGFTMPNLYSDDLTKNPLFFTMDFSINYYSNFKFTYANIDVSADASTNVDIENALNVALSAAGIRVSATYDPSTFYFTGGLEGYNFNVSNVVLGIIDSSQNGDSPFGHLQNPDSFTLTEDASVEIAYAKHPNTAMQGIILKGIYGCTDCTYDKWIYINHVSDYITLYDPSIVANESSLHIYYDPTTVLGDKPSFGVADVSGAIDSSIITNLTIEDASIYDCIISDSSIQTSLINNSDVSTSILLDSFVNLFIFGTSGRATFNNVEIWDTSINNSELNDCSIYGGEIDDSSINRCTLYNVTLSDSTSVDNRTVMIDPSLSCVSDTSTYYIKMVKKLDIGDSGTSTDTVMSAGDYLEWVTVNNKWNKVSEMYIWSSAPDSGVCTEKNLIDGFYVFNPHEFDVKIEYMVFV